MYFPSRKATAGGGGSGPSLEEYLSGDMTQFIAPSSVNKVRKYSFYDYNSLTKAVLHDGITTLEECCFYMCRNLNTIENFQNVKTFGSRALGYTAITEFEIPEGATSLGSYLFEECSKLTRVVIPSTVKNLQSDTFENCKALTDVVIRPGLTGIQNYCFYGCYALKSLTLPDTLKLISSYVFYYCGIEELTMPASMNTIYSNAFVNVSSLSRVTFENPEGWVLASSATATSGTPIDLSDPQQNAVYLKETYRSKYFRRITS